MLGLQHPGIQDAADALPLGPHSAKPGGGVKTIRETLASVTPAKRNRDHSGFHAKGKISLESCLCRNLNLD